MSDTENLKPDPNELAIYDLGSMSDSSRHYIVKLRGDETHVRVWTESEAAGSGDTYVSTTIGGPSRITSGRYVNDTEAIRAHLRVNTDAQQEALAAGVADGWQSANDIANAGDALATVWSSGRFGAELHYPNGWKGGQDAAQCRAAYVGGWAIGVQRYLDGVRADGTEFPFDPPAQI